MCYRMSPVAWLSLLGGTILDHTRTHKIQDGGARENRKRVPRKKGMETIVRLRTSALPKLDTTQYSFFFWYSLDFCGDLKNGKLLVKT